MTNWSKFSKWCLRDGAHLKSARELIADLFGKPAWVALLNPLTWTRSFCPIANEEMINCHWNQQTIIKYVKLYTYLDLYLVSWLINHKMLLFFAPKLSEHRIAVLWGTNAQFQIEKISDNRLTGCQDGS